MKGFDGYCDYLERLTADNVDELRSFCAADIHFKDPFNDVTGVERMRAVFVDMFEHVRGLEFRIHHRMNDGVACVIVWTLSGHIMNRDWSVDGASKLRFDAGGKLVEHIDHWDAAAGLYEKMPVVGWFARRLRKRLEVAS
ncbi:MAG: nuclear transport factor 2 family protein [Rhodospirillales bacterium]|nr:nuclear transport factor 2 family protein [Rhodospirillales bacterium]MBO6787084.1 nuclear transport factor 2 family protein [Rhodospirillales bacterium]